MQRKISAAGGRQTEGEEEFPLDIRYGERCGISGRGPRGLLPVLKVFLVLSKVQHFLRKELILADVRGHRGTDVCECLEASSTARFTRAPALFPSPSTLSKSRLFSLWHCPAGNCESLLLDVT